MVQKNVDLSLFSVDPDEISIVNSKEFAAKNAKKYLALGELKGGIDPAGADEHWKTANSALERIRKGFAKQRLSPKTFFVGAAIEKSMANEIYRQLQDGILSNAANLTNESQTVSLCKWLINL
jgi:type II restriction enzyme